MRTIVVMNTKGGSGKSTLATNLAGFYACWGIRVTLVDFDRQASSLDWLKARPKDRPRIQGIAADKGLPSLPPQSDYVIFDLPSGVPHQRMTEVLLRADAVLIPVLPSPMDIRATGRFVFELMQLDALDLRRTRLGVIANRVRENTRMYGALKGFLERLGLPFVATLRETQHYITAAEQGISLFEMPTRTVIRDLAQWQPVIAWLNAGEGLTVLPPGAATGS